MNPITNPFSRDEHPDLTAAIMGVVNEAKAAQKMDEDYQTPSRAALCPLTEGIKNEDEFRAKLAMARVYSTIATKFDKYSKGFRFDDLGYMAAGPEDLTPQYKKELENWAKTFKKMSVKLDNELYRYDHPQKKTKRKVQEAASPQGSGKKPFNPFNPTLGDLLRSKAQDKKAPKPKPVKEDAQLDEDLMTAARKAELDKKIKSAVSGVGKKQRRLDTVKRQADRSVKKAHNTLWNSISKSHGLRDKKEKEANSPILYGKGGKVLKRKVQEDAQLDERIIDEVDFFQASKNWIKGKGFKTNREATYDRVNKNYAAMKKREAAAKAKKTK
jgi:hypothetical protein